MRSDQRPQVGHVPGRVSTLMLLAAVLCSVAAQETSAQQPVYKEGTKAVAEPRPGDDRARFGMQTLIINPTDSLRALAPGNAQQGAWTYSTNAPQNVLYYNPSVIQSFTIPGQRADTTASYEATGASWMWVDLYPTFDDSTGAQLMALWYRSHPIQIIDSLTTYTTFPTPMPVGVPGSPFQVGDTLGSLKRIYLDNTLANPTITLRRNEWGIPLAPGPSPRGIRYGPFPIQGNYVSIGMRAVQVLNASGVAYSSAQWPHITYKADLWFCR